MRNVNDGGKALWNRSLPGGHVTIAFGGGPPVINRCAKPKGEWPLRSGLQGDLPACSMSVVRRGCLMILSSWQIGMQFLIVQIGHVGVFQIRGV